MAVQAVTCLLRLGDPPSDSLVRQHVSVAAASIEIDRERVPAEEGDEARILRQPTDRLGVGAGSSKSGAGELGGTQKSIELAGEVLPPRRGIQAPLVQVHYLEARLAGFGLSSRDVLEEPHHQCRGDRRPNGDQPCPQRGPRYARPSFLVHRSSSSTLNRTQVNSHGVLIHRRGPCPTSTWQRTQPCRSTVPRGMVETPSVPWAVIASVMSAWQRRQLFSSTRAFAGTMRMGSAKFWRVKALEWR